MQRLVMGRGAPFTAYAAISIVLWLVLILPRGLGWHSIAESLWTEDSTIFLNQAYQLAYPRWAEFARYRDPGISASFARRMEASS